MVGGDLAATPVSCLAPPQVDQCSFRWFTQLLYTDHLLTMQVTAGWLLHMGIILGAVDKVPADFCSCENNRRLHGFFYTHVPNPE